MKFAAALHMEGMMSCTEGMYHSVHCNLEKHLNMIAYHLISGRTQQETNRRTRVSIFLIFAVSENISPSWKISHIFTESR